MSESKLPTILMAGALFTGALPSAAQARTDSAHKKVPLENAPMTESYLHKSLPHGFIDKDVKVYYYRNGERRRQVTNILREKVVETSDSITTTDQRTKKVSRFNRQGHRIMSSVVDYLPIVHIVYPQPEATPTPSFGEPPKAPTPSPTPTETVTASPTPYMNEPPQASPTPYSGEPPQI